MCIRDSVSTILEAKNIYIVGIRSCAPLASFLGFYLNLMFDNVRLLTTNSSSELFEPVSYTHLISDITLSRLHEIFESIMKKQQDKIDPLRSKFGKIEKEEVSLEDKMEDLKKYAAGHRHFSFRGLLTAQSSKVEVIVTFLAILELMKMGTIRIRCV